MISAGQMINYEKYREQLSDMPAPILLSQLPHAQVDLRGLIAYAAEKEVSVSDLTEDEKNQFIIGGTVQELRDAFNESMGRMTLAEWNKAVK